VTLFVVREAYDAVTARLAALATADGGTPLRTNFGAKWLAMPAELTPNSYLWVPLKGIPGDLSRGITPEGHPRLWEIEDRFQIRCYAESHDVARTMLVNAIGPLFDAIQGADLKFIGYAWAEAVEDEKPPTDGALVIGEFGILGIIPNRYVHVWPREMASAQSPAVVPVPTTQLTGVEIEMHSSLDGTTNRELAARVTVPIPPP